MYHRLASRSYDHVVCCLPGKITPSCHRVENLREMFDTEGGKSFFQQGKQIPYSRREDFACALANLRITIVQESNPCR